MLKRILIPAAALFMAIGATAAPLTPAEALGRALQTDGMRKSAAVRYEKMPCLTERTADGTAALYVFNSTDNGYLIVGGDDIAYPVLGYSDNGTFDENNMPDAMRWWLDQYVAQIETARNAGNKGGALYAPESREVIAPICKTKWNQDAPFYNMCPTMNGQRCYSGCVATSMAQVMKTFNYPERGTGVVTYTPSKLKKEISMDLGERKLDWDNMIDYYGNEYTDEQADAVAYLMEACGFSVYMDYGIDSSGASGLSISEALVSRFGYDADCHSEYRACYSSTDWNDKVYDNLKNVGALVMNGQAPSQGGHSFVCDGYDGKGYYHFNWGWGGMSDGYFSLEALNPGAQGIGGFAGGFNFSLNAIFGIQPPTGKPSTFVQNNMIIYGALKANVNKEDVEIAATDYSPCGFGNVSGRQITVNLGLILEPVDNPEGKKIERIGRIAGNTKLTMHSGSYVSSQYKLQVNMKNVPDGRYKAIVASRDRTGSEAGEWIPMLHAYGYTNYIYVTLNNGEITVEDVPVQYYEIKSVDLQSELYFGKNVKMNVKIVNDTDIELTQGLCPQLYRNGKLQMVGESILVTVPAKTTVDKEWITVFDRVQGVAKPTAETEYELKIYNPATELTYGSFGNVTMKPAPRVSTIVVNKLDILDAPLEDVKYGENEIKGVYLLGDNHKFKVDMDYSVSMGYMDGTLMVSIMKSSVEKPTQYEPVVDDVFTVQPFLAAGETGSNSFEVDFPEMEKGVLYSLIAYYTSQGSQVQKARAPFMAGTSGVEGVIADDSDAVPAYFNLQGVRVDNPVKGQVLIRVRGGKADKVIVR